MFSPHSYFHDATFWVYAATAFSALIGTVVFLWWWYKNKKATTLYAYVTLLFASEFVAESMNMSARVIKSLSSDQYMIYMGSWLWAMKNLTQAIVYCLILLHVFGRIKRTMSELRKVRHQVEEDDANGFKPEVLIVEDNSKVCDMIGNAIHLLFPGTETHCVGSAEEALAVISKKKIILVVTDIKLPGMDGFELCKKIKDKSQWIVVIGMTGYEDDFERLAARQVGFNDYFIKPFRLRDMMYAIEREIEKERRWKKSTSRSNEDRAYRRGDDLPRREIDKLRGFVGAKHNKKGKESNDG